MAGIAKRHDDAVGPSIGPTGKLCWSVWSTQRPAHSIRTACYHKSKNYWWLVRQISPRLQPWVVGPKSKQTSGRPRRGDEPPTQSRRTSRFESLVGDCRREFQRQREPNDARPAGFGGDDLQFAMVPLEDLMADHQAQTQTDVARGVKRLRHFFSRIGSEAGAVVLKFDVHPGGAVAVYFRLHLHGNSRIVWIRLEGIQHHFGQRMLERGTVAGDNDRLVAHVVSELRRLDRLVFLGFLIRFLNQLRQRHGFPAGDGIPRQESHLVD